MAHYAKVENALVTQVIVAEPEFFDTFVDSSPGEWIQTSYNTKRGVHLNGGTPLRKNYAGVGYTYDSTRDAFYSPKPFNSWTLDESSCTWEPPIERPNDENMYYWDEENRQWSTVDE